LESALKSLVQPVINLNGTSKESLVKQLRHVLDALRQVESALAGAQPHGRDYQNSPLTGENGVYAAQDAWNERRVMITKLKQEIEEHTFKISQQTGGR
jgi:flagellar biosynthesis chaperone FliJ